MSNLSLNARFSEARSSYMDDVVAQIVRLAFTDGAEAVWAATGGGVVARTVQFCPGVQHTLFQRPTASVSWLRVTLVPTVVLHLEWGAGEVAPADPRSKNQASMIAEDPSVAAEVFYGHARKVLFPSE